MVERQDSDDEFQDCIEHEAQIVTNGQAVQQTGEEVIQVTSNDIEEVKVFDEATAR